MQSSSSSSSSSSLSGSARACALAALEDCTDALTVYRRGLRSRCPRPLGADSGFSQAAAAAPRASLGKYTAKNERAAFEMGSDEVTFQKLQQDCQWLEDLLHRAKRSLAAEGNLDVLANEVADLAAIRAEEDDLLLRAREAKERLGRAREEAAERRRNNAEEEERARSEVLRLRNEKEREEQKSRAELEYLKDFLKSRREQQSLRVTMTRERLTKELKRCQLREDWERNVTGKVADFMRDSIEENERSALMWTERRRAETRNHEKEIHRLRGEIAKRRAALDELRSEYAERQEFIDTCLAEKEATRRALELEEHLRGRAVRLQAWWRGVMVRRKLGPYRPEEKKRKRPAKSKK